MVGVWGAFWRLFRRSAAVPATLQFEYSPRADGWPDPGEIVWTWVPFEEGDGRGKDRPVLLIARHRRRLVGLMLSSKDHTRTSARGRTNWLDIGTGDWDARRRPSEVRLDRLVDVDPRAVRRRQTALDRPRFEQVVTAFRALHQE